MTQATPATVPSFQVMLTSVMNEVQESLAELVDSLPETIRRAVDLERALRLEKKLAWQVFRLSRSESLREVGNMPSRASLERVLEAARRKHVPRAVTERVNTAFTRFDDFAEAHCGDRAGLISMVSGLSYQKSDLFELKARRSYFQAASHIWGVQARMQIRTLIQNLQPELDWREDDILVSGDIGLQRFRETDPLILPRWVTVESSPMEDVRTGKHGSSALATEPVTKGVDLVPEFSSSPLPRMVPIKGSDGSTETELIVPPGRTGAVTLYSAQLYENVAKGVQKCYFGRQFVTMPVEAAGWELMVSAGVTDPATARAAVYGRRAHPEGVYEERPGDLLAQRETVVHLGTLDCVPPLDGAPNHHEAIRHVLKQRGWLGTRFDVYRCVVKYPVLHTLLKVGVDAARS